MVEQGVQNQQLSLFDTAEEQKFAGLAISFSEEDNYLMVTSQELPAEKLKQDLLERQELYAADLKPALAAFDLHDVPEEMRTRFLTVRLQHTCSIHSRERIHTRILQKTIWD